VSVSSENQVVIFERVTSFLDPSDLFRLASVSKPSNHACANPFVWRELCERVGIPLVATKDYDYKEHFKCLYPITIHGGMISRILGNVVEKVPLIDARIVEILKSDDPFGFGTVKDNYWIVVVPSTIQRTKETKLALDQQKNLVEVPEDEPKDLTIPLSVKNLQTLCSHLLVERSGNPIFASDTSAVVLQHFPPVDGIQVHLMRRKIPSQTLDEVWMTQEQTVKKKVYQVTPSFVTIFSHCIFQCLPPTREPCDFLCRFFEQVSDNEQLGCIYARGVEKAQVQSGNWHFIVGAVAARTGLQIFYDGDERQSDTGVVPGLRLDVASTESKEELSLI
jgi:hypothetical protein